jgi:hypothetical protein
MIARILQMADAADRAPLYGPSRCRHAASKVHGFLGSKDIRAIQLHFMFLANGGFPVTRISMSILLTGTALAMLAAAPARSVEAVNRLSANGVNPNGLSPNGLTSNERAANSASEIGRVIAVELPRRSGAGISVGPARPGSRPPPTVIIE